MKNFISLLSAIVLLTSVNLYAQNKKLAPDQNPQYMQSQNKYTAMADSVTKLHATTLQNTYKAYDFMEAKAERKAERISYRRNLRLERVRNRRNFNNYYDPYYNQGFSPFYNNYYNSWPCRGWRNW
jgi:uncharacterized protein YxeA